MEARRLVPAVPIELHLLAHGPEGDRGRAHVKSTGDVCTRFDTPSEPLDNRAMTQPGGPLPPLQVQPGEPLPAAPSKLGGGKMVLIVLAIVAACGVPLLGVLAALSIYGVKKYVTNAKGAEATNYVQRLAAGVARCANEVDPATGQKRGLPPSSAAVPATLASVRGMKYQSTPGEWNGAFTCAGFRVADPQYFQYRWEQQSETRGLAVAVGDLDGDGSIDTTAERPSCARPESAPRAPSRSRSREPPAAAEERAAGIDL